jgi:AcrR family transcriptional regulator
MLIDTPKSGSNYHHGNVKEALLTAAQNHIENNQGEKISLRALSKEVGITPSAVYNHFADKDALLLAIKIRIPENFHLNFNSSLALPFPFNGRPMKLWMYPAAA